MLTFLTLVLLLCATVRSLSIPKPVLSQQARNEPPQPLRSLIKRDPPAIEDLNIEYFDERSGTQQPMSDGDIETVRTAFINARAFADIVLNIQLDDPLIATYFGNDPGQHIIIMQVFQAIRDFNPAPFEPLRITRQATPPGEVANGHIASTRPDEREMDLYADFWTREEAGAGEYAIPVAFPTIQPGMQVANADNLELDELAARRGAVILHEMVHYVTGRNRLLVPQFERMWPDPHTRPQYHIGAARDLSPMEWVEQGTNDNQIIQALPAEYRQPQDGRYNSAYTNEGTRALARMNRATDLTVMNAENYVQFALAVLMNRRAATLQDGQVPNAPTYEDLPTVLTNEYKELDDLEWRRIELKEGCKGLERSLVKYSPELVPKGRLRLAKMKAQLDHVQHQITPIEKERKVKALKLVASLTRSCRELCSKVATTLPLELRVMVYETFGLPRTINVTEAAIGPNRESFLCPRISPGGSTTAAVSEMHRPISHIWKESVVGRQFLEDLTVHLLSTSEFATTFHDDICEYLQSPTKWMPCLIPRNYITTFTFMIFEEDVARMSRDQYAYTRQTEYQNSGALPSKHRYPRYVLPERRGRLLASLQNLSVLRKETNVKISILTEKKIWTKSESSLEALVKRLEFVMPVIQQLHAAGHLISVYVDNWQLATGDVYSPDVLLSSMLGLREKLRAENLEWETEDEEWENNSDSDNEERDCETWTDTGLWRTDMFLRTRSRAKNERYR
ncbi:hypothetical protein BDV96DRAFT_653020 [Lophiotrema nucula]|uniref:Uncharacterized protein n=1 Tax=Lophiotrema nucula TaxID=690887 RepID=A0A6A5YN43_9PLEO|nr:hypothetical protein BDV96DRAFT_653020 [Lophiotrema nucula]